MDGAEFYRDCEYNVWSMSSILAAGDVSSDEFKFDNVQNLLGLILWCCQVFPDSFALILQTIVNKYRNPRVLDIVKHVGFTPPFPKEYP